MKKLLLSIVLVIFIIALIGCSDIKKEPTPSKDISLPTATSAPKWSKEEWSISKPEDQGIHSDFLDKANTRILDNYPNVYSFLVVRNGYLVYEKYYQGMSENNSNPVYSITKSVMSALTGIAINKHVIQGTSQKVSELIPKYFEDMNNDKKKDITIEQVLTMSGGLDSVDNSIYEYYLSPDWMAYTLKRPLIYEPGKKFTYNTGLTQALSNIITEKSKMSTLDFANQHLFQPLNIKNIYWDCDSTNSYGGGAGLHMTPRDMAKFGYLYLKKGNWDGRQIIPEEWVATSTRKHIRADQGRDYGYLFWINQMYAGTTGVKYDTYSAIGAGGQKIIVVPQLDLVVVITANINSSSLDSSDDDRLVADYVLPGIIK